MPKKGSDVRVPRYRPAAVKELRDWALGRWKMIAMVVGAVGLLAGSVTKIHESWEIVGPIWPPSTSYMMTYVSEQINNMKAEVLTSQKTTNKILYSLQMDSAQGKLDSAQRDITTYQAKQLEPLYKDNSFYHDLVDRSLKQAQDSLDVYKQQIEELRKQLQH